MTFSQTASNALAFARQHDWGQSASLKIVGGNECVVGIVERWSGADDKLMVLPARRSAIAEWAGY